jgi:hypothetical protein
MTDQLALLLLFYCLALEESVFGSTCVAIALDLDIRTYASTSTPSSTSIYTNPISIRLTLTLY